MIQKQVRANMWFRQSVCLFMLAVVSSAPLLAATNHDVHDRLQLAQVEDRQYQDSYDDAPSSAPKSNVLKSGNDDDYVGIASTGNGMEDDSALSDRSKNWTTPGGLVGMGYNIGKGNTQATFAFTIHAAPSDKGYYFAEQFRFVGNRGGYIGLRPRPDGMSLAAFSIFGGNVEIINTEQCHTGADGGTGISCSVLHPLEYDTKYLLTVKADKDDPRIWRGYVKNSHTGEEKEIGAYRLSQKTTLEASSGGFVEYYKGNGGRCDNIQRVELSVWAPQDLSNGNKGVLKAPMQYGHCKNTMNYRDDPKFQDGNVRYKFSIGTVEEQERQ